MHTPVLLNQVIEGLNIAMGDMIFDGTFGLGGHSKEILKAYKDCKIIGVDLDKNALEKNSNLQNVTLVNDSYENIQDILTKLKIQKIDGAILDLGVSSLELGDSGRGFSFNYDEPLIMRFKTNLDESDLTAHEVINYYSEEKIADIIYKFGEERNSRKIAKAIVQARSKKTIESSKELGEIIANVMPRGKTHSATKTFQALRIFVNDELGVVDRGIRNICKFLNKDKRLVVITFHSLEDRLVKNIFKELSHNGEVILVNKKVIKPEREEVLKNKRSRSAKLRIVQKA